MPPNNQLHQLLQEDQEPFRLRDYIADRRTKLTTSSNQLQLTRMRKPPSETTNGSSSSSKNSSSLQFPVTFCKNACFNAKHHSPDLTRSSPVFHFPKSPVELLHIPSKTAALLLEAALRIHKQSSRKHSQKFGTDLGFFGSVLRKLAVKTQKRNDPGLETSSVPGQKNILRPDASSKSASGSVKLKWDSIMLEEGLSDSDMDFCCNGRRSDAIWSEDKSLETETSCSSSNSDVARFVGDRRVPDFSFHPSSPSHRTVKDGDDEDKEQCSPVCVLDLLFEEEDVANDGHEDDHAGYGVECSYASLQRKKHRLLHKLSRFETVADLNPKELEKIIFEDEVYDKAELEMVEENGDIIVSEVSSVPADEFLRRVVEKCGFHDPSRISIDMKILITEVMAEEEMKDELHVVNSVCAKPDTIDMMVDQDLKQESDKWKKNREEVRMVSMDIESAIYSSLVRELLW